MHEVSERFIYIPCIDAGIDDLRRLGAFEEESEARKVLAALSHGDWRQDQLVMDTYPVFDDFDDWVVHEGQAWGIRR